MFEHLYGHCGREVAMLICRYTQIDNNNNTTDLILSIFYQNDKYIILVKCQIETIDRYNYLIVY